MNLDPDLSTGGRETVITYIVFRISWDEFQIMINPPPPPKPPTPHKVKVAKYFLTWPDLGRKCWPSLRSLGRRRRARTTTTSWLSGKTSQSRSCSWRRLRTRPETSTAMIRNTKKNATSASQRSSNQSWKLISPGQPPPSPRTPLWSSTGIVNQDWYFWYLILPLLQLEEWEGNLHREDSGYQDRQAAG